MPRMISTVYKDSDIKTKMEKGHIEFEFIKWCMVEALTWHSAPFTGCVKTPVTSGTRAVLGERVGPLHYYFDLVEGHYSQDVLEIARGRAREQSPFPERFNGGLSFMIDVRQLLWEDRIRLIPSDGAPSVRELLDRFQEEVLQARKCALRENSDWFQRMAKEGWHSPMIGEDDRKSLREAFTIHTYNTPDTMRFTATFADGVVARIERVIVSFTYNCLLEGSLSSYTRHEMSRMEERQALIESGRLKGFYCFDPELMDEREFWDLSPVMNCDGKCFKDNSVEAVLTVAEGDGQYGITLEWFSSTREMKEIPLEGLVQQHVGRLRFEDIRRFCKYNTWEELA